jgi:hypothetical protein
MGCSLHSEKAGGEDDLLISRPPDPARIRFWRCSGHRPAPAQPVHHRCPPRILGAWRRTRRLACCWPGPPWVVRRSSVRPQWAPVLAVPGDRGAGTRSGRFARRAISVLTAFATHKACASKRLSCSAYASERSRCGARSMGQSLHGAGGFLHRRQAWCPATQARTVLLWMFQHI